MSHENIVTGTFTANGQQSAWVPFNGKFNFCLANTNPASPQAFPTGVEIVLVALFNDDVQEYLMLGPEGVVYTIPGVHVVDIPEPRMTFRVRAIAIPGGTTVVYRLSR